MVASRRLAFVTRLHRHRHVPFSRLASSTRQPSTQRCARAYDAQLERSRAEVSRQLGSPPAETAPCRPAPADRSARAGGRAIPATRARMVDGNQGGAAERDGAAAGESAARAAREASSSCTPTTASGRPTTGRPGIWATAISSPSSTRWSRSRTRTIRQSTRKITSIKIVYKGKEIPAKLVDTGNADVEVDSGDWAIIKTRELDLPALQRRHGVRLRVRRSDLPPRQRLLEGHHRLDRLRRPADVERPGHLPDRRSSRACRAAACSISAAISSASRSAGCRATIASRSSCRCEPR